MSSNPSYQQFGAEATNSCFINSGMISAEAPFFHPYMPQDGSFGFGYPTAGTDIAAHFMANNMMIASPANQLVCAAPLQDSHHGSMSSEEMNDAYVASESCSTVHSMLPTACSVDFQYGPSDVTIAQPSKMTRLTGEPQCSWIHDGPTAISIHEPYCLTGFSGTDFSNPFAAGSAAAGELSLRRGAESSSVSMVNLPDQSSEVSCSGLTRVNSKGFGYQQPVKARHQAGTGLYVGVGNEVRQVYPQMYSRPLHFSQVLSRSRYTHVAQEILNGVVGCLLKDVAEITDSVSGIGSEAGLLLSSSCSTRTPSAVSSNQLMLPSEEHQHDAADSGWWMEAQRLRSDLLELSHLMDQKCNQCFDDIQNTTSKFSSTVHSGGASGISAPFAQHAVSVMYRRLRKRIMSQIMVVTQRPSRGESSLAEKERSWESSFIQKHWALQQLRRGDQQSWRPQRGLPEKSVAVLKAWMFENFLRPYPKDNEKEMLAVRSGLSRSQVSNWFINARVRLWKPMIEEMYEELKKTSGGSEGVAVEHPSSKDVVS